jgi:hypothetical protein
LRTGLSSVTGLDFLADAGAAASPVDDAEGGVVEAEADGEVEVEEAPWPEKFDQ